MHMACATVPWGRATCKSAGLGAELGSHAPHACACACPQAKPNNVVFPCWLDPCQRTPTSCNITCRLTQVALPITARCIQSQSRLAPLAPTCSGIAFQPMLCGERPGRAENPHVYHGWGVGSTGHPPRWSYTVCVCMVKRMGGVCGLDAATLPPPRPHLREQLIIYDALEVLGVEVSARFRRRQRVQMLCGVTDESNAPQPPRTATSRQPLATACGPSRLLEREIVGRQEVHKRAGLLGDGPAGAGGGTMMPASGRRRQPARPTAHQKHPATARAPAARLLQATHHSGALSAGLDGAPLSSAYVRTQAHAWRIRLWGRLQVRLSPRKATTALTRQTSRCGRPAERGTTVAACPALSGRRSSCAPGRGCRSIIICC